MTINTGVFRGPLSVLLSALARSAGYEVIYNFNVDALPLIDGANISGNSTAQGQGNQAQSGSYSLPIGKPTELPAKPVVYSLTNKPFNDVWPLLMDVYDLQYEVIRVGNGDVIRISQRPAQLGIS